MGKSIMAGWLPPLAAISKITSIRSLNKENHWIVSVVAGIIVCKIVYDLTAAVSNAFVKKYNNFSDITKLEWNERGVSTFHATAVSLACGLLLSDLFDEGSHKELITRRKSNFSDTVLGMSISYFISDLVIILRHFPALGGIEYVVHHGLAMSSIFFSLSSGQAQVYALMILFTETTTPLVNLRWYLDVGGKKNSKLYIFNGVALFFGWLVARILLFVCYFYHLYWHFDEAKTLFPLVFSWCVMAPPVFAVMNLIWFIKIAKGTVKALSKLKAQ